MGLLCRADDWVSNLECAALRAMTGLEGESASILFGIFIQLFELCGAIQVLEDLPLWIVIANENVDIQLFAVSKCECGNPMFVARSRTIFLIPSSLDGIAFPINPINLWIVWILFKTGYWINTAWEQKNLFGKSKLINGQTLTNMQRKHCLRVYPMVNSRLTKQG